MKSLLALLFTDFSGHSWLVLLCCFYMNISNRTTLLLFLFSYTHSYLVVSAIILTSIWVTTNLWFQPRSLSGHLACDLQLPAVEFIESIQRTDSKHTMCLQNAVYTNTLHRCTLWGRTSKEAETQWYLEFNLFGTEIIRLCGWPSFLSYMHSQPTPSQ